MTKCPCRNCIVLPVCITQYRIKCEKLSDFLNGYKGSYRHDEVKYMYKKFSAAVIGYNDFSDVISITKKKDVEK